MRSTGRLGWGTQDTDTDEKAKVSAADTTTDYLNSKIVAGAGIAKSILNPGANETLEISAPGSTTDELVKASVADTTPNYLTNKLTAGYGLTKSIINPAGNEEVYLAVTGIPASLQPQWIAAGAWEPLSTNTYIVPVAQELTGAGDIAFTTLRYDVQSADEWFFITTPPVGWTSGKIRFIPHYLVVDSLGTPQTMIFELGCEYMADGFLPNATTAWQTITSTKTAGSATVPQYMIGTESAELTITGSPGPTGAIALRMKRGADAESDPLYFVGCYLKYI